MAKRRDRSPDDGLRGDPALSLNWSALKDFLAVAETGSLSGAARRLGVSQPTLTRRMAALEAELQTELFRRSSKGLELTDVGEALLEPTRRMDDEAHAAAIAVTGRDRALEGVVRITATEGLATDWLASELASFREVHPRIALEILVQNTVLNVLRREADIAIRLNRPQQQELVARRVGELQLGLFASRGYLAAHGEPRTLDELTAHQAVAFGEADRYTGAGRWIERRLAAADVVYRANTLGAQRAAIRAGFGIGAQSRFIAERDPELVRVLPDVEVRFEIWLVTHPGLRRSARIRAVYDFLAKRLSESRALLGGTPPAGGEGQ